MKKVYSPIRLTTETLQPGAKATVQISNRHNFTNVNDLSFHKYG